jgi:hypothetical protein
MKGEAVGRGFAVQTRKRNKKKGRLEVCPFEITHPRENKQQLQ